MNAITPAAPAADAQTPDPLARGTEALCAGRYDEAARWLEAADLIRPDDPAVLAPLAEARVGQGRHGEAYAMAVRLFDADPKSADRRALHGAALAHLGAGDEAIRYLAKTPDRLVYHLARAAALSQVGRLDEAEAAARRAASLGPDRPDTQTALGDVLSALGRHGEALAAYGRALKVDPAYAPARLGKGRLRLALGDFRAWPELDWRLNVPDLAPEFTPVGPAWDGSDPAGKTLLLLAEPAVADTLMFVRYAALLRRAGARVLVLCRPELGPLLGRAEGVDRVITDPWHLNDEPVDAHADLLSLPGLLGVDPTTIPAEPYLSPDPECASRWASELATLGDYRVAIHWAADRPDRRSIPLPEFAPLAAVAGVALVSVQTGARVADVPDAGLPLVNLGPRLAALDDTAAVLAGSDLVVTNDGPIAHLAGALGVPCWVILPVGADWRWQADRTDSPWYPSLRLYRQSRQGDWSSPFAAAAHSLRAGVATRRAVWALRAG